MQKKKTKKRNLKADNIELNTRLFSIRRGSRFLFVSSSNSNTDVNDIVRLVCNVATKERCDTIIHAGWSFMKAKRKSAELIIDAMHDILRGTRIRTYIVEIGKNYYIGRSINGRSMVTKCTRQRFYNSSKKQFPYIERFLHEMKTLKPVRIASAREHPCFLLICGENNIFNKHNRAGSSTIRTGSSADQFLESLHKIQGKPWIILNPSHRPYTRPAIYNSVRKYHKASSRDSKRVSMVVTGNNRSNRTPKVNLNRALIWKNGKPKNLDLLNQGQEHSLYTYLGRI